MTHTPDGRNDLIVDPARYELEAAWGKVRVNLTMPLHTKQLIEDLQTRTGAGSMSETIRRALALLDVVTEQQEKGGELYLHWPDGQQSRIHIL